MRPTAHLPTAPAPSHRGPRRPRQKKSLRTGLRFGAAVVASGALATTAALSLTAAADASASTLRFQFVTLNDHRDVTFNQLLGINNNGHIAGYFGSGAAGHPNKGYILRPPYSQSKYQNINFPQSVQTQVTGLNDEGVQVGFWSSQNNASLMNNNFGWYLKDARFHEVNFPTNDPASPPVDQLLGVNNHDVAVGFYTDGQGNNHGYEYNIITRRFSRVLKPGAKGAGPSLTAAAINNRGDVAGFYVASGGVTDGFLKTGGGVFIKLAMRGATMTQAFGVNDHDEVVGAYTVGAGSSAKSFGFVWRPGHGFTTVNDPHGVGTTFINGVNNAGDLVGFYTDAAGNTDGMLALPR
jgi:hypothetical protein